MRRRMKKNTLRKMVNGAIFSGWVTTRLLSTSNDDSISISKPLPMCVINAATTSYKQLYRDTMLVKSKSNLPFYQSIYVPSS